MSDVIRVVLAGLLCLGLTPPKSRLAPAAAAPQVVRPPQFSAVRGGMERPTEQDLHAWADAVWTHQAGQNDAAVTFASQKCSVTLYLMYQELRALPAFSRNPRVLKKSADGSGWPLPRLALGQVRDALGMGAEEAATGNANLFLLRAALLHTDTALLGGRPSGVICVTGRGSPFSGRSSFETQDGRQTSSRRDVAYHLEFAAWLLDGIRPDPAQEIVRAWYDAMATGLTATRNIGDAQWLIGHMGTLFPNDARFPFLLGTTAETEAAPRMQNALSGISIRGGIPANLGNGADQSLRRAKALFKMAVDLQPDFAEARLHLARVTGLAGSHQEALDLLTPLADAFPILPLNYYQALFLGGEQDATGARDAARASFERAGALVPKAQSPLLALSQISRRAGDSQAALAPLKQLLALPPDEMARNDPFWWYDISHALDANTRLDAWRATVPKGTRQ